MVNTGIRVDNGKNIELDHNTMYGNHGSGWCCFEMESSLSNINIHHNILHDYHGSSGSAAVQPVHASGNVNVYNNVLWNVGPISMGSGSGNIINPSDQNVANWVAKGYGYGSLIAPTTTDSTKINESIKTDIQQLPVAAFSVSTNSKTAPMTVKFTDKSTGSPTSCLWKFGDKSTSTSKNPVHNFKKAGKYTVSLTVRNAAGDNTVKKTNCIIVKQKTS
jgi:PKD repeat protein